MRRVSPEACHWPVSKAAAFYATLATSVVLGIFITLTSLDPIKALYWSAVINGFVAVSVMTVMVFMAAQRKVMGKFVVGGVALVWVSTAAMGLCVVGTLMGWFI